MTEMQTLTLLEMRVLSRLLHGETIKEIADYLDIKANSVAFNKYSLMTKLGATSSAHLISYCMRIGLLRIDTEKFTEFLLGRALPTCAEKTRSEDQHIIRLFRHEPPPEHRQ